MKIRQTSHPVNDPRERILAAAVHAFAVHGFHGATTRSIAAAADVNISMINYYFGSKQGLLKTATQRYFEDIGVLIRKSFNRPDDPEQQLNRFIRAIITYFRSHRDLVSVVINTWSLEIPEATAIKIEFLQRVTSFFDHVFMPRLPGLAHNRKPATIVGPAMIGSIALHFLFRPVIEEVRGSPCDDAFYEEMTRLLTTLFSRGLIEPFGDRNTDRIGDRS